MKNSINKILTKKSFNFWKETCNIVSFFLLTCDAPDFWQLSFQDPASSIMEGIMLFNKHLLFIVVMIVVLTSWLLFNTIYSYDEFKSSKPSNFFHSNELEIVWTSLPALTLLTLASPSFSLLYSMDEISIPDFSIKILGHQWFWSYEISDFRSCLHTKTLKYACYMLSNEELNNCKGFFRNLETNKRVILPTNTHMRLLVSAVDVLHSWTIPSFGLKIDACPGRLNQVNLFIKRFGVFFGQCSEICGVNHGFMPIVLLTLPTSQYHYLIMTNLENHSD
nr:cytochrome c oxidase subunit 2 [Navicula sp.]